jgi:hypothetical protein
MVAHGDTPGKRRRHASAQHTCKNAADQRTPGEADDTIARRSDCGGPRGSGREAGPFVDDAHPERPAGLPVGRHLEADAEVGAPVRVAAQTAPHVVTDVAGREADDAVLGDEPRGTGPPTSTV